LPNLQVRKVDPVPALTLSAFELEAGTGSSFLTCKLGTLEPSFGGDRELFKIIV
jgi:hypothetical protein